MTDGSREHVFEGLRWSVWDLPLSLSGSSILALLEYFSTLGSVTEILQLFSGWHSGRIDLPVQEMQERQGLVPSSRKIHKSWKWQPANFFLEEVYWTGRLPVGCSHGHKESDRTE